MRRRPLQSELASSSVFLAMFTLCHGRAGEASSKTPISCVG
jgi:hypothetical protein